MQLVGVRKENQNGGEQDGLCQSGNRPLRKRINRISIYTFAEREKCDEDGIHWQAMFVKTPIRQKARLHSAHGANDEEVGRHPIKEAMRRR